MESTPATTRNLSNECKIFLDIFFPQIEEKIYGEQPAITNNPYKDEITYAQENSSISSGEREFLTKREPIIRDALQTQLHCNLNNKKTPTIACIFSGGGYRAMLCALGSLLGFEKEQLLEIITYIVTLSGSTWTLAPWFTSGMSLNDFSHYLHKQIKKHLSKITEDEKLLLANMIAVKELSKQPITFVDLYGGLLGNRLLKYMQQQRHITYLSQQRQKIEDGSLPYPIYTAISGDADDPTTSWYTFTPHQVANLNYGVSIPTQGCGRHYENKTSTNNVPELPLSILLGTWGSAFAANINDIIDSIEENDPEYIEFLELLKKLIKEIGNDRIIPCELKLPNFTVNMETPISHHDNLQIVDAGIKINLPFPPISGKCPERIADIMLFFDNSAGPLGEALKKCIKYAKKNNLPFPDIDLTDIDKKTVIIFKGNEQEPLVIYMPGNIP